MEVEKRQRAFYLCSSFTELLLPDYNPIKNVLIGARLLVSIRVLAPIGVSRVEVYVVYY